MFPVFNVLSTSILIHSEKVKKAGLQSGTLLDGPFSSSNDNFPESVTEVEAGPSMF